MEIAKFSKKYHEYFIFLRRKDLQAAIEHAVYINGAERINIIDDLNQVNSRSFIQTDNTQIDNLIKNIKKIKNCTVYFLLRNCYSDYILNKKKIIYLKNYIKNFRIVNHFSYYREKNFQTTSYCYKINKKISEASITGLKFKEKIRILFPNFYTVGKIPLNLSLSIQLLLNRHLIFCGKYFFTKKQNTETVKSSKFSRNTKKNLDRLDKYKKIQNKKVAMKDLSILKKILKNKKTNYYEIFYLIQCFTRTLIFNHLRKFNCCKLFYKPTLNLTRTNIFKNIIQIDVNSLVTPGLAIDRHWNLKKNYKNKLSLLFFDKNYLHSKKNFYNRLELMIKFISFVYSIKDYSLDAINLKNKLKNNLKKIRHSS